MDIREMTPMNGRILIEVVEQELPQYEGNILLTQSHASKEKTNFGIVKKVYKEYDGKVSPLKEGDTVVFPSNTGAVFLTGTMYDSNRAEYRVIKESDLLGTL